MLTTNSNSNGLQQTIEKLLFRISNMETSINDLQTRQVQIQPEALPSRSDAVREQDRLSLHASLIRNLVEEIYIPQLRSCNPASQSIVLLLIK